MQFLTVLVLVSVFGHSVTEMNVEYCTIWKNLKKQHEQHETSVDNQNTMNVKLDNLMTTMTNQMTTMMNQMAAIRRENEALRNELKRELVDAIQDVQNDTSKLHRAIEGMTALNLNWETKMQKLTIENDQLIQNNNRLNETSEAEKQSSEELKIKNERLESDIVTLNQSLAEKKQSSKHLKNENKRLESDIVTLNQSLTEEKQSSKHFQTENERLESDIVTLNQSLTACVKTETTTTEPPRTENFLLGGKKIKGTFAEAIKKIQERNETVQLYSFSSQFYRMSVINNNLWVPIWAENTIKILDMNKTQIIKNIKHSEITTPRSVAETHTKEVLIGARNGLFLLDEFGSYLYNISNGDITDIYIQHDRAYVYNHKYNTVATVTMSNYIWRVNNTFVTSRTDPSSIDTIIVNENIIYVSSFRTNNIQTYTTSGTYLRTYGSSGYNLPGELRGPFLCGIDSQEAILVCDFYKSNLQVLYPNGSWEKFKMNSLIKPSDILIDNVGNFWIQHNNYKITKFLV